MPVLTSLEELISASLSLLDNVATFLLTFALVYAAGRFVASLWIADPDRDAYGRIRSGYAREIAPRLEREGIDLGRANPQALEGELGVAPKSDSAAVDGDR